MSDQTHRRIIGPHRVRRIVDLAIRGGVSRVELVARDSFAPLGPAAIVAEHANSALAEAELPWVARVDGDRVFIERSAR